MNINEALIFCEKVANKDRQGLLGRDTFNAFAPAAQLDAILVRAPFYGAEEGITNELIPVTESIQEIVPHTGVLPITKFSKLIRLLSVVPTSATYEASGECDLLPLDQFRKRAISKSAEPIKEFSIAAMTRTGMQILPKTVGNVIVDFIMEPVSPFWNSTGSANDAVYNPSGSVNFTLPTSTHIEICARILVYAGLHLSDQDLQNWGLTRASITSPRNNG